MHLDFEDAFPIGHLTRPVISGLPKEMFSPARDTGKLIKLQDSLNRLKDAASVWSDLLFNTLNQHDLTEMETTPCLFVRKRMIAVCYVDDLFLFAEHESVIEDVKRKLSDTFRLKSLSIPTRFLGMDLK